MSAEATGAAETAKAEAASKKGGKSLNAALVRGGRARWWRRRGTKRRGFWYETAEGRRVTDEAQLERIKSLVIPPAWQEVRISPAPRSRLQAVGLDSKRRAQYLYHPSFAARQQRKKYAKIERFGELLPVLRRKTNQDLAREGLPRERVVAVVLRLINHLFFRVGSEDSVKKYRTYGITTLRNRHFEVKRGGRLEFNFVGKHSIRHRRTLYVDAELAALLRDIKALGGAKLFEYIGEDGKVRVVTPRDVNEYIKAATGPEFSAKDFRTWGGTRLAAVALAEVGCCADEKQAKRNIVRAVKRVAEHLGNTPTVCRSCYIHPAVMDAYLQGVSLEAFRPKKERRIRRGQMPEYEPEDIALLKLLRAQSNGQ